MWDEIEKRTGWEVEVKQASFDAMWGELDTNRVDVVANCLAVKPERTDKYNATIPYYGDSQCIIVNDDSDYKTADDLKEKQSDVQMDRQHRQLLKIWLQKKDLL